MREVQNLNREHSRYREILLNNSIGPDCTKAGDNALKIVLFHRDEKLRSHAVKHFTNTSEMEEIWKKVFSLNISVVLKSISDLQDIGCPYFSRGFSSPPCIKKGGIKCSLFEKCSEFTSDIENEYLCAIDKILKEGVNIPRYAFFSSTYTDPHDRLCLIPNTKIVLKASLLKNNIYNLSTCYGKTGIKYKEMLYRETKKITDEAFSKNISWYSEKNWGLTSSSDKKHKKRKNRVKNPYKRCSGGGWQQYLDSYDE